MSGTAQAAVDREADPLRARIERRRREARAALERARSDTERALALSMFWRAEPLAFIEDVLGLRLWAGQEQVVEAVRTARRVAVRSGHKLGKSTVAAAVAVWFAVNHERSQVVITSTKADQIDDTIWREVKSLARSLRGRLAPLGAIDEPNVKARNGWVLPNGSRVYGRTAGKGEGFAGISGTASTLLFIVDEASGIRPEIYEVIEGNRAGGAGVLLIGNPTQPSGPFFDAFHRDRALWRTLHLSTLELPNVRYPDRTDRHIPGLATAAWVEEKRREWGGTPAWDVRVLGNFSTITTDTLVSLAEVEAAVDRWKTGGEGLEREAVGDLHLGVDVARFGDDLTVIQAVRGPYAYRPRRFAKEDLVAVAGHAVATARDLRRDASEEVVVAVDGVGIGAGVVDALRAARRGAGGALDWLIIHDVCGQTPGDQDRFADLRTELWVGAVEWLRAGGALPDQPELEAELVAVRYRHDARGRQRLEPKDATRVRLHRSPDFGDALALACHRGRRFDTRALDEAAAQLPTSEASMVGRWL